MAISGTTGARIPTSILTRVSEVQDAHRAIQVAIPGERQVTTGTFRAIGIAIHGRFRATLLRATAPLEAHFGAGNRSKELAVGKGWQFMSALFLRFTINL